MLEDGFFDPRKPLQIRWGDLPHWRQDGALYFVTFRLSDSLPKVKLDEWRRERDEWRRHNPNPSHETLDAFSRQRRRRIEQWLDRGIGCCALRMPEATSILDVTLRHFDAVRYELGPYAVAPNHVHALVRTAPGIDLSDVVGGWKTHSALEIRRKHPELRTLSMRHFWQVESFDHIVRDPQHLDRYSTYIRKHVTA